MASDIWWRCSFVTDSDRNTVCDPLVPNFIVKFFRIHLLLYTTDESGRIYASKCVYLFPTFPFVTHPPQKVTGSGH
jgi:hypothetical protein